MNELAAAAARQEEELAAKAAENQKDREHKSDEAEKQRKWQKKENRKDRFNKIVSGITSGVSKGVGTGLSKLVGAAQDPSWYNAIKELVDSTANISTVLPIGRELDSMEANLYGESGIMVFNYVPTLPLVSGQMNKDFQRSMDAFYTKNRMNNSGARNYQPGDLIYYVLAISNAYEFISWCQRLYRSLCTKSTQNYWFGLPMFKACLGKAAENLDELGISVTKFYHYCIQNLENIRSAINIAILNTSQFALPNVFSLVSRRVWMNSNVFTDISMTKTRFMLYNIEGFFANQGVKSTVKQVLTYNKWETYLSEELEDTSTMAEVLEAVLFKPLTLVVDSINKDSYAAIISGDILRTFKATGDLKLASLVEGEMLIPTDSDEIRMQLHHITMAGRSLGALSYGNDPEGAGSYVIEPATEGGITQTKLSFTQLDDYQLGIPVNVINSWLNNSLYRKMQDMPLLDLYTDNPTNDDIMVATRMIATFDIKSITSGNAVSIGAAINTCGTEVCTTITTFCNDGNGADEAIYRELYPLIIANNVSTTVGSAIIKADFNNTGFDAVRAWSNYDWAPMIRIIGLDLSFSVSGSNVVPEVKAIVGPYLMTEADNEALVSRMNLKYMHGVASINEFGLAQLVKGIEGSSKVTDK